MHGQQHIKIFSLFVKISFPQRTSYSTDPPSSTVAVCLPPNEIHARGATVAFMELCCYVTYELAMYKK